MKLILRSMVVFLITIGVVYAQSQTTKRIPQFSNEAVTVWKTIVYPSSNQALKMHRHDNNRVVVALTDGVLKVTNDKGKVHYLTFKKDQAYYLTKDILNELHGDENITNHPIKVMVIELNRF
jgi:hypothetical protein